MVCPYSLTVPGGVQGQVFGLARALRERGHTVQIIGPADGPSPEGGVRAVGPSLLNAANGSMAHRSPPTRPPRCARSESCATRTFDVVHLHEPLVPGPTVHRPAHRAPPPLVGTFHAAGDQPVLPLPCQDPRPLLRGDGCRCQGRGVEGRSSTCSRGHSRAASTLLFNGVELERVPRRRADGPTPSRRVVRPSCSSVATRSRKGTRPVAGRARTRRPRPRCVDRR
jgi:phosphatidylinositol alpha-mannosyltransferase